MNHDEFIWITGWAKHQDSLTKRGKAWSPPWVKLEVSILDDHAFNSLPMGTRYIFLMLLPLFARHKLVLPSIPSRLSKLLDVRVTSAQLESLSHAGLIEFCSETVLEQRKAAFWNCSNRDKSSSREEQDQDLEVQDQGEAGESAAAEDQEPIRETELRTLIDQLGGDRRSHDIVEPLAMTVTRGRLLEIVATVETRRPANPVGLLVKFLKDEAVLARARTVALHVAPEPEPTPRIPPRQALEQQIKVLAGNGHQWPQVLEAIRHGIPEHLTEESAQAVYDSVEVLAS